jgi:hypothetical protein
VSLEVTLRFLPTRGGAFAADPAPDWPAHRLIPHSEYTFSAAWNFRNVRHGVTNNMGYVAPFDYVAGMRGIAVIGDSYIEALMNSYSNTLQGQLAGELNHRQPILNFGMSGAEMPDYLGIASMVTSRFDFAWVVILIDKGDFTGGFAPGPGYFKWDAYQRPPIRLVPELHRRWAVKLLRQLALVRYVRGNLRASLQHLLHSSTVNRTTRCMPGGLKAGDDRLLQAFAAGVPQAFRVPPSRVILIFDADRAQIYTRNVGRTSMTCATRDGTAREYLARTARALGENVIDMTPVFAAYINTTGERVDYSPIDSHWNAAGHRLAAMEVARTINEAEASAR